MSRILYSETESRLRLVFSCAPILLLFFKKSIKGDVYFFVFI